MWRIKKANLIFENVVTCGFNLSFLLGKLVEDFFMTKVAAVAGTKYIRIYLQTILNVMTDFVLLFLSKNY